MTDTTVPVTQEDRELGAAICELLGLGPCQHILDGLEDDVGVVPMVARHRLAAEQSRASTPAVDREALALRNIEAAITQYLRDWEGSERGDAFSVALSVVQAERAAILALHPPASTPAVDRGTGAVSDDAQRHLAIRSPLNNAIYAAVRGYRMGNMADADDPSCAYPLVDLMSNPAPADIGTGEMEMVALVDEIEAAILALHPPVMGEVEREVSCICGDSECRLWLEHGHD